MDRDWRPTGPHSAELPAIIEISQQADRKTGLRQVPSFQGCLSKQ